MTGHPAWSSFHTPDETELCPGVARPAFSRILGKRIPEEHHVGGAVAVAVMRRKERDLRGDFMAAGALQPIDARSLEELRLEENMTFRRLRNRSVIRETAPGMFYWDEDVWQSLRAMRRRMALLLIVALVIVGIMLAYGSTQLK
jgi:hypothetical protein